MLNRALKPSLVQSFVLILSIITIYSDLWPNITHFMGKHPFVDYTCSERRRVHINCVLMCSIIIYFISAYLLMKTPLHLFELVFPHSEWLEDLFPLDVKPKRRRLARINDPWLGFDTAGLAAPLVAMGTITTVPPSQLVRPCSSL